MSVTFQLKRLGRLPLTDEGRESHVEEGKSGASGIPLPRAALPRVDIADTGSGGQRVEDADLPDALPEKGLEVGRHDLVGSLAMVWDEEVLEEEPLVVREAHGHGGREDRRDAQENERVEECLGRHFAR